MDDKPTLNGQTSSVSVKPPSSVHIPKPLEIIIPPITKPQKPSLNGNHHNHSDHLGRSTLSVAPSSTTSFSTTTTTASSDFDLLPFNSTHSISYTSLKDILPSPPSALLSPTSVTATAAISGSSTSSSSTPWVSPYEISIRNRLVKQAAWAYLQPSSTTMPSSPSTSGRRFRNYFSGDILWATLVSVKQCIVDSAARVCNWLADALWLLLCR